jgi:NhaP-type Na+/H+ and K+/H+ antiporter
VSLHLALLLTVFGALLLVAVRLDVIAARRRIPGILLVLLLGLFIRNDIHTLPLGVPQLLSLQEADQVTQISLVLVLFFGGLTTNWHEIRPVLRPSVRLATFGSMLSALLITGVVLLLGALPGATLSISLPVALFVGAMLCSTDASAVLALLRPLSGVLPRRLLDLLESESSLNDPMAVVLAGLALAMAAGTAEASAGHLLVEVLREFLIGILLGFLGGSLAPVLLRSRHPTGPQSLLAVASLAVLMLLVGGTELLGGSGILAAYIAGLVLGNSEACDRAVLEEAHAGFAKLAELLLFLCLGLVVRPEDVVALLGWSSILFLVLLLVRWLMVKVMLIGCGFPRAERLLISVSGLRGAVPIALAIQAGAEGVPWGAAMPPLALGVVLLGLVLQGASLVPVARRLGLASRD